MDDCTLARVRKLPVGVRLNRAEIVSWFTMPETIDVADCASSNVKSYGWHAESNTLKVIFSNGTEYRYIGVSDKLYADLAATSSKGSMLSMIKSLCLAIKIDASFYEAHEQKE